MPSVYKNNLSPEFIKDFCPVNGIPKSNIPRPTPPASIFSSVPFFRNKKIGLCPAFTISSSPEFESSTAIKNVMYLSEGDDL